MDDWTVTHVELRANGIVHLRGVSRSRGPFQVFMPASEYETRGPYEAVRGFYAHHPTMPGRSS